MISIKIFQNYHRHSMYTNIRVPDSVTRNEDYAKKAQEYGHGIISTLEHGTQGRYIEGYELAHKYNLKFLFGTEAYWVKDRIKEYPEIDKETGEYKKDAKTGEIKTQKDNTNAHICIFAKNENGRQSINDILAEANDTGFYYQPRIDLELLFSLPKDDVWVTSACLAYWKYNDDSIVKQMQDYFKHNFYLEVQYHNTEMQSSLNRHIIELSNRWNIPIIMGCDSHFMNSGEAWERDDYMKSKGIHYAEEEGWYLDYPDGDTAYQRFVDQGVLTKAQIEEAMENTNVFLDVQEYDNPCFNFDIKMPTLYPNLPQEERDKIYIDLIWSKWGEKKHKISQDRWTEYESEIQKEIDAVVTTKHADYFLLDYKIVEEAVSNGGLITDTGRGSAVSYYTNNLLGLTKIDRIGAPVKMYPERFISPTRILESKSLADLDLNTGNPEVFAVAQTDVFVDTYGEEGREFSYPMIAYGTLKAKSAWKMYAKAKEIDFDLANVVSEQIEKYEKAMAYAEDEEKEDIDLYDYVDEEYHDTLKDSENYLGIISDYKQHPCFDKNTLVMTSQGYKIIKDVIVGDYVLTHTNNFKKVLNTMSKRCNQIYNVKITGDSILVTGNHPFFVRSKISGYEYDNYGNRMWIKKYDIPCWKTIEDITENDRIGIAINQESIIPTFREKKNKKLPLNSKDFWWMVGRYMGDGWIYSPRKHDYRIFICCNKNNNNEKDEILARIPNIYNPRIVEEKTSYKITFNDSLLYDYLKQFGKYSHGKRLTSDILNLPIPLLESFLNGYLSADGHFCQDKKTVGFTTVSKELAYGLQSCIHKVYKMPCTIAVNEAGIDIIESRICNTRKKYRGKFKFFEEKKDHNFYDAGYIWTYFRSKELINYDDLVYNLEVEDDSSYTANNFIVHNCGYLIYQGNIRKEIGLIKVKAKTSKKEVMCTIMDGKWAEDYKFFKNDLLKVSVVEVIKKTYQRIGIEPHDENELIEICKGNQKVWDVYKNGSVMGINQVEQNSTKHRVMKYEPTNISELCAFVAAIRPGFKSMYSIFEKREPFTYNIPAFDKLIQTPEMPNSFLLYQEMAMAALNFAGVPMSECYDVIKNIAKKRPEKVKKYKDQFMDGFKERLIEIENIGEEDAQKATAKVWHIIDDSCRYSFNASHSYSVAMDSLYGAYLKSHYPLYFYEVFLNVLDAKGSKKDRMAATRREAELAYRIRFEPLRFRQDNRKITADDKNQTMWNSLKALKGFGEGIAKDLYELRDNQYDTFVDLLVDLEEKKIMGTKIADLIKIQYFEEFGLNGKLLNLYNEFTSGKSKYDRKHKDATKLKRIEALKELESTLPNEQMSLSEQMTVENEILGYIQATVDVDKRYIYVMDVNTKFSPRIECYCLANGKTESMKINKKLFSAYPIEKNDIIYIGRCKGQPQKRFDNGKFYDIEGTKEWWIEDYTIVKDFDKRIK